MKQKKLLSAVISAVMILMMLPAGIAFASEIIILDNVFDNTYSNDNLAKNHRGNPANDSVWNAGSIWGVNWGGEGHIIDAEDGSLALASKVGADSNAEISTFKRLIHDTLVDNSTLIFNFKFRTGDKPTASSNELWFRFYSEVNGSDVYWTPFFIRSTPAGDPVFGWEITSHYWPFSSKKLDRDPNTITFKYDKDYEVIITLKPNTDPSYKLVVEVYEEGTKIGAGIMDQMATFTPLHAKKLTRANLHVITRAVTNEFEPVVYMKYMGIKAIQPNVPINAVYYPRNGEIDAPIDTDCYVVFESAVNEVTPEQVEVEGGASVAAVRMGDDNKKVIIDLEGRAANTAYTVKLKNVKTSSSDIGFDYSWSFTTNGGVEFSEPHYGAATVLLDEPMGNLNLSAVATTNTEDEGYIAGNKWASTTSDRENITPAFEVNGEYLYANLVNNGDSTKYTDRLYKRFDKIENGDNLVLSGYINLPAEGRAVKRHSLMLTIGSGDNLESNTYSAFRFVTTEHHNKHALFGLEKNPSNFSSDEADYPYGDGVTLRDWGWWNYHTEKDDVLYSGKDVPFTLTLTPDTNDSNYYDAQIKIGANDDYVGTRKIPASEVTAFDRLTITLKQFNTATTANYVGLKDLKIIKSQGHFGLAEGNNKLSIDYTNISGGAFSSDILFVERDADDNTIVNVTVVRNENVLNESGTLICDFEIMNSVQKLMYIYSIVLME